MENIKQGIPYKLDLKGKLWSWCNLIIGIIFTIIWIFELNNDDRWYVLFFMGGVFFLVIALFPINRVRAEFRSSFWIFILIIGGFSMGYLLFNSLIIGMAIAFGFIGFLYLVVIIIKLKHKEYQNPKSPTDSSTKYNRVISSIIDMLFLFLCPFFYFYLLDFS